MARPLLHEPDAILDAARDLVARGGRKAATVSAISAKSRAPSGSLYHRFGSQDRLLLEAWIRAIRRFQEGFLTALTSGRPKEAAVAAALWTPRFADEQRSDAAMLLNYRREDLLRNPITDYDMLAEVASLNEPLEKALRRHAARIYGRIGRAGYEALTMAIVDLPYGAVRRHLSLGEALPVALPQQLEAAVRAAIDAGPTRRRRRPPAGS